MHPLAFAHRRVGAFFASDVIGRRADDFVVGQLFQNVCAPSGNAACGEDTGEDLARDPHVVLQACRIEIDVAIFIDGFFDLALELDRNVVPFGLSFFDAQAAGELFEMHGAGVFDLVDSVPEAHEFAFRLADIFHEFGNIGNVVNFMQGFKHLDIGAAVEWTFQSTDGTGDGRVDVGECGNDDACGKRTGVEPVFGMQNQNHIHGLRLIGRGVSSIELPHEVAGMAKFRFGRQWFLAVANAVNGGDDRREAGD